MCCIWQDTAGFTTFVVVVPYVEVGNTSRCIGLMICNKTSLRPPQRRRRYSVMNCLKWAYYTLCIYKACCYIIHHGAHLVHVFSCFMNNTNKVEARFPLWNQQPQSEGNGLEASVKKHSSSSEWTSGAANSVQTSHGVKLACYPCHFLYNMQRTLFSPKRAIDLVRRSRIICGVI